MWATPQRNRREVGWFPATRGWLWESGLRHTNSTKTTEARFPANTQGRYHVTATANVLVPLDGSTLAEEALDVAIDIAGPAGGVITLFVAAEPEAAAALHEFADSEEITQAMATNAYLEQVAERVKERGVQARPTSSDGTNVAAEIVDKAVDENATMIVMTSHGRSGIGRWLLGSVADKVARSATVPVAIVPCSGRS